MRTFAILPVKRFDRAKQRLRDELSADEVAGLAESMLGSVLDALARTQGLQQIVVVTQEPRAVELARRHGATVLRDDESGHNPAALRGIGHALARRAERALLVPGDCPRLDPDELDGLLQIAASPPSVLIVPDRHGTGTNALLLTPPDALEPSFGPGSCARHQQLAREHAVNAEVVHLSSLAHDVDTPQDLAALTC